MSNRDVNGAIEWLPGEQKPSQSWAGLCQSASRNAYKMPAYGSSAKQAWANVENKYKTKITSYKDDEFWSTVPRGAILYSTGGTYGHAWVADSDETAWSVDYKRHGKIDRCPIRLSGWSGIYKATVGYITGAQYYADNKHTFKGLQSGYWDGKIPPLENIERPTLTATCLRCCMAAGVPAVGPGLWTLEISPDQVPAAIPRRRHGAIQCQMGARHGRTQPLRAEGPRPHLPRGSRHAAMSKPPRSPAGACYCYR